MSRERYVFVGTYTEPIRFGTGKILQGKGKGIHVYKLDVETGALRPWRVVEGIQNPSYLALAPSRRFLYAVNELKEYEGRPSGAVSAFALDPNTGDLTFLNQKATHGTDPCHLTVDATEQYVLVANFMSGSVCVLPIQADGSLGDATDFIQHEGSSVHPTRQTGPHAHAVTLDATGQYVYVPDLGLDQLMIYQLNLAQGTLEPASQPWIKTAPGAGPRQVVMHPSRDFAYLINELDSTMTAYRYQREDGSLRELQTLSTLPEGFSGDSTCAEVQIAPSGKFLYGSNRGHDSIVIYAVDQNNGTLTAIGHRSAHGKTPRNFVISPDGDMLIIANQDIGNMVTFKLDQASGDFTETGFSVEVGTPVCVKIL
ncbi:MAG: lactonase family protein [Caldilineaceae bacterium]|nr:lactonase family protein [Caldilineaceae bacterium]